MSKKNKYWQAEILWLGFKPAEMDELTALEEAAKLCGEVQEKKKTDPKEPSQKTGERAPEGKMPHYNRLNYKKNQQDNDELLEKINDEIERIRNPINNNGGENEAERHDNYDNGGGNDDSSGDDDDDFRGNFGGGSSNRYFVIEDEENNTGDHFNPNEFADMQRLENGEDIEGDESDSEVNNQQPEDQIINDMNDEELEDIIFVGKSKRINVIEDEDEDEEDEYLESKNSLNTEIREIFDVTITQTPAEFLENGGTKKQINSVYWLGQKNKILKMIKALRGNKIIRVNKGAEYTVEKNSTKKEKILNTIAKIYGVKAKNLFNTLDVLEIRHRPAQKKWTDNEINKLRIQIQNGQTRENLEKIFKSDARTIKKIASENDITFSKRTKKPAKKFVWTEEITEEAQKMYKNGDSYNTIAEKFGIHRKTVSNKLQGKTNKSSKMAWTPEKEKRLLEMKNEGLNYEEISIELGCKASAARSKFYKLKEKEAEKKKALQNNQNKRKINNQVPKTNSSKKSTEKRRKLDQNK